jgi:hypothetical protein
MKKLITICLLIAATFTVNAQQKPTKEETIAFMKKALEASNGLQSPFGKLQNVYFSERLYQDEKTFGKNNLEKGLHAVYDIKWESLVPKSIDIHELYTCSSVVVYFNDLVTRGSGDADRGKKTYGVDREPTIFFYVPKEMAERFKKACLRLSEIAKEENKEVEPKYKAVTNLIDSLCVVYKYKDGMPKSEFRQYNSEAGDFMDFVESYARQKNFTIGKMYSSWGNIGFRSNVTNIYFDDFGRLQQYIYYIITGKGKDNGVRATENYNKMVQLIESKTPKEFIIKTENEIKISNPKGFVNIIFSFSQYSKKEGHFKIWFERNHKNMENYYGVVPYGMW